MKAYLLNFVAGHLASPDTSGEVEKAWVERTRAIYDAYPEIPGGEMSEAEVRSENSSVVACAYGTPLRLIFAVANLSSEPVETTLWIPGRGSVLYDRLSEQNVLLAGGLAWLELPGYAQMAYELR